LPVYRKGKPEPNQWLLDIAEADRTAPPLVITPERADAKLIGAALYIEFTFDILNTSIYPWLVRAVDGHVRIGGEVLTRDFDLCNATDGAIKRPGTMTTRLRLGLFPEQARLIKALITRDQLTCDFAGVSLLVARDSSERPIPVHLPGQATFPVRERF
jgi:hypothetical protein